jgi:hypothetical protein
MGRNMMTKPRLPLLLMTALLLAGLALPAEAAAPPKEPTPKVGQRAGIISALLPVAHIVRGAGRAAVTTQVKKGDDVNWSDLVRTERGGRARITLSDQSILSLGSQAELRVVKHDARTQQTALQLAGGRLRAEVTKIARMGGSFELRTPTAVAGVIGTDFGTDASTVGTTTFLCISGVVQVSNIDPNIAGGVQCTAGMTTSVSTGKTPTPPKDATPEQIQQLILDTEPAIISAMSPLSAMPGTALDAVITGTKLANAKSAKASGEGVTASLTGTPTDTSATVHISVAPGAQPGPRTITLSKQSGAESAAVFTVMERPKAQQAGGDPKKGYHDLFEQERLITRGGLGAYLLALQQSIDLARQQLQDANSGNVDLSGSSTAFAAELASAQSAVDTAGGAVDKAAADATAAFDTLYATAYNALLQRSADGTPDNIFNAAVQAAYQQASADMAQQFNVIRGNLDTSVKNATANVGQIQNTWMSTVTASAKQPPVPAVNSIERTIDLGGAFGSGSIAALDAANSKATPGATIMGYHWVLCGKDYRPAQFGVPIAGNATGCNPIPGYASSSSEFSFATCNLEGTDYIARVTVTDSNNQSSAMDVKVHVLPPTYEDAGQRFTSLAQAYGTLQPNNFMSFFDETNFPDYTSLSENVRKTLPELASMQINAIVSNATTTCNDATVRGTWDQVYGYKSAPSVTQTQHENLEMRLVRAPGKGWMITYFAGDNGTVPAIASVDTSAPDLAVTAVFPSYASQASSSALPVPPGTQSFTAIVANVGTADLSASNIVRFTLSSAAGTATVDAPLPVPLKPGQSENVAAQLPVPANIGMPFTVTATANPAQTVSEPNLANNTGSGSMFVGTPVKMAQVGPSPSFIPGPGGQPQTLQVSVSDAATVTAVLPTGITTTSANPQNIPPGGGTATWVLAANFDATQGTGLTMKVSAVASGVTVDLPITYSVQPVVFTQTSAAAFTSGLPGTLSVSVNTAGTYMVTLPSGFTASSGTQVTITGPGTLSWNLLPDYTAATGSKTMQITALNGTSPSKTTFQAAYTLTGVTFTEPGPPTLPAGSPTPIPLVINVNSPGPFLLTLPSGVKTTSANPQTATPSSGGYTLLWQLTADLTVAAGTGLNNISVQAGQFTFQATYSVVGPSMQPTPVAFIAGDTAVQTMSATVSVPGTYTLAVPTGITSTQPLQQTITSAGTVSWPLTADFTATAGSFPSGPMTLTAGVYTVAVPYTVSAPTFNQTAHPSMVIGSAPQNLQMTVNVPGTYLLALPAGVTTSSPNPQAAVGSPGQYTLTWSMTAGFAATPGTGTATVTAMAGTTPSQYTFGAGYTIIGPTATQTAVPSMIMGGITQTLSFDTNSPGATFLLTLPTGITTTSANPQQATGSTASVTWVLQADTTATAGGSLPITMTLMNGSTPSSFSFSGTYSVAAPTMTLQQAANIIAGGLPAPLVATVNAGGNFTLQSVAGFTATPSGAQTLPPTGGTLQWYVSADFSVGPGTQPFAVLDGSLPLTPTLPVTVSAPSFTQTAKPVMDAGGATQRMAVSVDVGGTFLLALPAGIATTDPNPQTLTGAGTLTWNTAADLTATPGTDLPTTVTAMIGSTPSQYSKSVAYDVVPPTCTLGAPPNLDSGGPAQPLTCTVSLPGTYKLVVPSGVTVTTANPVTVTTAGPVTWDIAADFSVSGSQTATIQLLFGSVPSQYSWSAPFTVNGGPKYVISSVTFVGHNTPLIGADALQVGEAITVTGTVLNIGNSSPGGTLNLALSCTGDASCGSGPLISTNISAPTAGDPNGTTYSIQFTDGLAIGSAYTGNIVLTEASTTWDQKSEPFENVDFSLAIDPAVTGPVYGIVGGSTGFGIKATLYGTTTSFNLPATITGGAGFTYTPSSVSLVPGTTQPISISGPTSSASDSATITGSNRGVARVLSQPVQFLTEQVASTNVFLNDPSNPLEIQMGQAAPQIVSYKLSGDVFSGSATITTGDVTAAGFTTYLPSTTATSGGTFDVEITATTTATSTITILPITITFPNGGATLSATLYLKAVGLPDLKVVSATPSFAFSPTTPWLDGQGVDWTVTIENNGQADSSSGITLYMVVDGAPAGQTTLGPIAKGTSVPVTLHAVAPDQHGTGSFFGTSTVKVHVDSDPRGDMNYTDNKLTLSEPTANWHIGVSGPGTQGSPLPLAITSSSGTFTATPDFAGSVDGGASLGSYPPTMFSPVAGQVSSGFNINNFTQTGIGTFNATVSTSNGQAQSGAYFTQVIVQAMDQGNVTAQRQATVWLNVTNTWQASTVTATPTLFSSRNNCQGPGCVDASGNPVSTGATIQINGGLSELFAVTLNLSCYDSATSTTYPCPGNADLAFQDSPNVDTTPGALHAVPTGTPTAVQVGAATDASGEVIPGPASGYLVGVSGVQHQVKHGDASTAPDAVGLQIQFLFNVGDLDVTSDLPAHACLGVPANSPTPVTITANWNPLNNFNAQTITWEIEDANHVPVGTTPVSFSATNGTSTYTGSTYSPDLPQFTLVNNAPQDGLLQYFLAATISNGTSTATKYFPLYVDASLTQNYCGAAAAARGFRTRLRGTWSRSAAGFGGPATATAARPAAQKSAGGMPDVRVSAADISFTPSVPRTGDTVQVRFRLRNEGDGNAAGIPVALQVNGATVAMNTFDVPAGGSALGGLTWTATVSEGGARSVRAPRGKYLDPNPPDDAGPMPARVRSAAIVIDPQHTQAQKTALEKSALLAHFGLRDSAPAAAGTTPGTAGQRLLIELGDGACIGLRPAGAGTAPCGGSADVELTAADLSKTLLTLEAMSGVADMGTSFTAGAMRGGTPSFSAQMAALSGHSYAVRLADGRSAMVTFESVRNPAELDARARAIFRRNAAARVLSKLGGDSGPADPGDLTGGGSGPSVFITLTVQPPE